jgi:hypothetical protein
MVDVLPHDLPRIHRDHHVKLRSEDTLQVSLCIPLNFRDTTKFQMLRSEPMIVRTPGIPFLRLVSRRLLNLKARIACSVLPHSRSLSQPAHGGPSHAWSSITSIQPTVWKTFEVLRYFFHINTAHWRVFTRMPPEKEEADLVPDAGWILRRMADEVWQGRWGYDFRQRVSVGSLSFGLTCAVRGFC